MKAGWTKCEDYGKSVRRMKKKEAKANAILSANVNEVKAIEVEKSRKSSLKQQQRDKCIESFHCPILGCQKNFDKHKRKSSLGPRASKF